MTKWEGWTSELTNDGSSTVVADLYAQERTALVQYATRLTHDAARAEDLVQDAFVRALSHLDRLAELTRAQRRAWLHRVVKNLFIDQTRRRGRWDVIRTQIERSIECAKDPVIADVRVWELLDAVPETYREVLHDRFVLGMTSAEIGERHGLPAATVRSRLRLGMTWLRKHSARLLGRE